ncbi:MAG: ArsR family transcriptional regulator [Cetobacterium sp.]|nr:ArsR family transcriptional regulator [Cetobacterium sp.]
MLKENIIKMLTESEPMKVGELAEALKADKKEVEKIVKELKKEEIVTSPKRCYITIEK